MINHTFKISNFNFQLRHDMIDQKEGETEFSVKIQYDDMVNMKEN